MKMNAAVQQYRAGLYINTIHITVLYRFEPRRIYILPRPIDLNKVYGESHADICGTGH